MTYALIQVFSENRHNYIRFSNSIEALLDDCRIPEGLTWEPNAVGGVTGRNWFVMFVIKEV